MKILKSVLIFFYLRLKKFFFSIPRISKIQRIFLILLFKYIDKKNSFSVNDKKKIILVYDCLVSPPTFGEFLRFAMIAFYFKKKKEK